MASRPADHIGQPQKMANASGALSWHRVAGIFGDTVSQAVGSTAANPLRFPGQQHDPFSALHYNYYRNYDPATGRYLETDPIGLAGGMNVYLYASANPVNIVDPDGRAPLLLILPAIGGVAGGLSNVAVAGPCDNKFAAFGRGFVSGAGGTLAAIGASFISKNPFAVGAVGGAVSQRIDQSIAGTNNLKDAVIGTALGGIGGTVGAKLLPTIGRLPSLTLSRTLPNIGPNSLRLIGQETGNGAIGAVGQKATSSPSECGC